MDELSRPVLRISRSQLVHNIAAVRKHLTPSALMLVMKDDAYGHGVETVVDAALVQPAVTRFGGYDVETSLRIRSRAGSGSRVFAWAISRDDEIRRALREGIELGVGTSPYLERVIAQAAAEKRPARVHLKIDTGLRRNGIRAEEWPDFVAHAVRAQRAGVISIVGVWSHLAEASDEEDDISASEFAQAVAVVRAAGADPAELHLTASAASWWRPELRGTVCRVGAFCYGIRSADGPEIPGIRPIATLEARVMSVENDVARIGVGGLHGLPTTLSGAPVATPFGPRKILRIDAVTSTVCGWDGMRVGDQVRLFGPGDYGEVDATTLAERIGTVGEEILTRLTGGVRRVIEAGARVG